MHFPILLALTSSLCMDRNCVMSPRVFQQLYVIHAPLGETAVLCVYALLPNKSVTVYVSTNATSSTCLTDASSLATIHADPTTVVTDYELAIMHEDTRLFCGIVNVLAFLPLDDIPEGIAYLQVNAVRGIHMILSRTSTVRTSREPSTVCKLLQQQHMTYYTGCQVQETASLVPSCRVERLRCDNRGRRRTTTCVTAMHALILVDTG